MLGLQLLDPVGREVAKLILSNDVAHIWNGNSGHDAALF